MAVARTGASINIALRCSSSGERSAKIDAMSHYSFGKIKSEEIKRESPPLLFATLFAVKHTNSRQFGHIHEHVIRHIIYRTRRRGRFSNPRRLQSRITHHKGAEYYQGFCQRLGNTLCARDIYMLNVKETNSNPAFIWLDKRYSCCWMLDAACSAC